MCEPTTIMLVAGAALSGMSAISQGQQAKATANYQAAQAEADADAAKGEARLQADAIRKAGQRQRSAANASLAASGVTTSEGTADLINREIDRGAEQDALTAIFSGNTRSRQLTSQAQGMRIAGSNAAKAGFMSAASTALRAGSTVASGWKSAPTMTRAAHLQGIDDSGMY